MTNIITYDEIDRSQWEKLVRESRTGTWFQSPSAYEFFAGQPKLFAPFVVAVRDERLGIRGICVGYVTIEKSVLKQFFTRRAIILGGPVCADDCTDEEVYTLMHAVRQRLEIGHWRLDICKNPIYIETRNFNDYSRWKEAFERAGFSYKKHLNFHVDCTDEEAMWERLSENRRRQLKKSAAISELAISELEIREWYGILERLYKTKVKTPLWPVEFFLEAYRQGVGKFLLVKHEGKVIGGSMVVVKELGNERVSELGKGCVYEWFECGMNAEYKEQYPSVMATWAGMKLAHEMGCARYDMMGAGEPGVPYGVRDFKSEFGGEIVEQGRFLCICEPILYKFGTFVVKLLKGLK